MQITSSYLRQISVQLLADARIYDLCFGYKIYTKLYIVLFGFIKMSIDLLIKKCMLIYSHLLLPRLTQALLLRCSCSCHLCPATKVALPKGLRCKPLIVRLRLRFACLQQGAKRRRANRSSARPCVSSSAPPRIRSRLVDKKGRAFLFTPSFVRLRTGCGAPPTAILQITNH